MMALRDEGGLQLPYVRDFPPDKSRLGVVFIPRVEIGTTSERSPGLLRVLSERYPVSTVAAPWDRLIYDPRRNRAARAILYAVDKFLLTLRGLRVARRSRARVVVCESAHHAVAGLLVARILGIRCVWDSHGNGRLFYESLGKGPVAIRLIAALERFLGNRVDNLVTVSRVDAIAYERMGLPPFKVHVIPVCVDLAQVESAAGPPRSPEREDAHPVLLLFGSFRYAPNREALDFVNGFLAPGLERRGISCEIRVAGRDIPSTKYHPSVRPLGFVPNIYEELREADVVIVPVRRGVGQLTKVLDAMAVGTPAVMFPFAAQGFPGLTPDVHAYVASTDEEFLNRVVEALASPHASRAMAARARQLIEETYDWRAYLQELDEILDPRDASIASRR